MSHIELSTGGVPSDGQIELKIDFFAHVLEFQINSTNGPKAWLCNLQKGRSCETIPTKSLF